MSLQAVCLWTHVAGEILAGAQLLVQGKGPPDFKRNSPLTPMERMYRRGHGITLIVIGFMGILALRDARSSDPAARASLAATFKAFFLFHTLTAANINLTLMRDKPAIALLNPHNLWAVGFAVLLR